MQTRRTKGQEFFVNFLIISVVFWLGVLLISVIAPASNLSARLMPHFFGIEILVLVVGGLIYLLDKRS